MSPTLLQLIAKRAETLVTSTLGCQFMTEVLLESPDVESKAEAKAAVAALAAGDPLTEDHIAKNAAAGRMLKTLVLGGQFDPKTKKIAPGAERLGFGAELYHVIKQDIVAWACSDSSFVVVGLLESEDVPDDVKDKTKKALKKGKKQIEAASKGSEEKEKGNAGAKIVLEKL